MIFNRQPLKASWYYSLIPINMSIGSIKIIVTLIALSMGASLIEIGIIITLNAVVTIVMSIFWVNFRIVSV